MYLDSRDLTIHPVLMAPVLVLTILFAPIGLLAYLAPRTFRRSPGYTTKDLGGTQPQAAGERKPPPTMEAAGQRRF